MKTYYQNLLTAALLLSPLAGAQAQFTAGNLVVLRDGDGSAALSSAGTAIFLDQFTTVAGGYVNSFSVPSTGASALVNSGSATSEGALNLSADSRYLVLAGYNANAGTASIASSTAATVPRGVATVNASGSYNLAATSTSFFSANNIRSGASDGSGNYWAAGANTGVAYLGNSSAPAPVSATSANNRVLQAVGNNLYFSTGSGSTRGVYVVPGNPTSGTVAAVNLINTPSGSSPYDFAFNPGMTLAYVADSDAFTSATGMGGIEKWAFNGSAWTFQYSVSLSTNGAVGLAVDFSGSVPRLYATSADGKSLFTVADGAGGPSATLLDTAAANTAFRGLDFSPITIPEPTTCTLAALGGASLLIFRRRK